MSEKKDCVIEVNTIDVYGKSLTVDEFNKLPLEHRRLIEILKDAPGHQMTIAEFNKEYQRRYGNG